MKCINNKVKKKPAKVSKFSKKQEPIMETKKTEKPITKKTSKIKKEEENLNLIANWNKFKAKFKHKGSALFYHQKQHNCYCYRIGIRIDNNESAISPASIEQSFFKNNELQEKSSNFNPRCKKCSNCAICGATKDKDPKFAVFHKVINEHIYYDPDIGKYVYNAILDRDKLNEMKNSNAQHALLRSRAVHRKLLTLPKEVAEDLNVQFKKGLTSEAIQLTENIPGQNKYKKLFLCINFNYQMKLQIIRN